MAKIYLFCKTVYFDQANSTINSIDSAMHRLNIASLLLKTERMAGANVRPEHVCATELVSRCNALTVQWGLLLSFLPAHDPDT